MVVQVVTMNDFFELKILLPRRLQVLLVMQVMAVKVVQVTKQAVLQVQIVEHKGEIPGLSSVLHLEILYLFV